MSALRVFSFTSLPMDLATLYMKPHRIPRFHYAQETYSIIIIISPSAPRVFEFRFMRFVVKN